MTGTQILVIVLDCIILLLALTYIVLVIRHYKESKKETDRQIAEIAKEFDEITATPTQKTDEPINADEQSYQELYKILSEAYRMVCEELALYQLSWRLSGCSAKRISKQVHKTLKRINDGEVWHGLALLSWQYRFSLAVYNTRIEKAQKEVLKK